MQNDLNETSHSIGKLDGKLDSLIEQVKIVASNVTSVYDKQVIMNGSISKSHWRHDENDKKMAVNEAKLIHIQDAIDQLNDTKKKVIWTIGGVSLGGGLLGSKVGAFLSGLF
jgi:hypothetical protein